MICSHKGFYFRLRLLAAADGLGFDFDFDSSLSTPTAAEATGGADGAIEASELAATGGDGSVPTVPPESAAEAVAVEVSVVFCFFFTRPETAAAKRLDLI